MKTWHYVIKDYTKDDFSETIQRNIQMDAEEVAELIAQEHYENLGDEPCEQVIGVKHGDVVRWFKVHPEYELSFNAREITSLSDAQKE